jgi:L-lactate dehydrogenase
MRHSKIAIIGAGSVGSTTAYALLLKNVAAEIILVDINEQRCKGEILDLSDALSFCGPSAIRSGTPKEASQADIIVIAAGARQQPGQDRAELHSWRTW